jgi:hypothetical protein
LQVSRSYLAFLRGVEPLEELIEAEVDVVGLLLLLLLGILLRWCLRRWGWGWRRRRRRRRCMSTGSAEVPVHRLGGHALAWCTW